MPSSHALHPTFRVHLVAGCCQKTASHLLESNANTERPHPCLHRRKRTLSHDIQNVWRTSASPHDRLLSRSEISSRRSHSGKATACLPSTGAPRTTHVKAILAISVNVDSSTRMLPMSPSEARAASVLPLMTRRISPVYPPKCLGPSLLSVGGMKTLWGRIPGAPPWFNPKPCSHAERTNKPRRIDFRAAKCVVPSPSPECDDQCCHRPSCKNNPRIDSEHDTAPFQLPIPQMMQSTAPSTTRCRHALTGPSTSSILRTCSPQVTIRCSCVCGVRRRFRHLTNPDLSDIPGQQPDTTHTRRVPTRRRRTSPPLCSGAVPSGPDDKSSSPRRPFLPNAPRKSAHAFAANRPADVAIDGLAARACIRTLETRLDLRLYGRFHE